MTLQITPGTPGAITAGGKVLDGAGEHETVFPDV